MTDVYGINDSGQIVGYYLTVPEPSTMLLFGPFVIGFVGFRKKFGLGAYE